MTDAHGIARDQLRAFIERIERLEEEKKSIADDIKDVYGEAKGTGFDPKILREVIKIRKQDKDERAEREAILDTYLVALGMIAQPDFFDDEPQTHAPVERKAAVPLRADGGMNIVTKHTGIQGSDGSPSVSSSLATREAEESVVSISPETAMKSPRKAAEAVSERAAFQDERNVEATVEQRSSVLVGPETGLAVAGELGKPEAIPALTVQHDGVNVGGPERAGVTAGETATQSDKATVATQGEATAPTSDERVSLPVDDRSDAAANAGGDHVESIAPREFLETEDPNTGEGNACALPTNPEDHSDDGIEFVPPVPMKRLHYAHCFPELTKAEYGRLQFSIAGVGIQKPIIRMGDVIVDGWARYNIARSHGIAYPVTSYHGKDVLLDVIEWQRASRNFTPVQEKKIAADLAKEIPHRAKDIMAAFGLVEALEAAE